MPDVLFPCLPDPDWCLQLGCCARFTASGIWGKEEDGLVAPPNLGGLSLHVVKTANATNGHYGEMAGGQPWVYD